MRILILDSNSQIRDGFIMNLIPAGYEVVTIKENKEILTTLAKKPFNIAIIEVYEEDLTTIQIIKIMRTDKRYENIKIIVHVLNPSKQFVIDMIKLGIVGYLLKPFNEKEIVQRLSLILERACVDMPERKYVRVKPLPTENISIAFRSPVTHKVISGKATDISASGLAFNITSEVSDEEVQIKQVINNFQVQIGSSRTSMTAVVIVRKGTACTVLFKKISDFDLNTLCRYIYERLVD